MLMNKNIIIAILFLLIGFGAGYYYFNKIKIVETHPAIVSETEQATSEQNKLFAFLDSRKNVFVEPGYTGQISIPVLDHTRSLMIIYYPIHQEGANYAIYDYKNNIFYDKIGNSGIGEVPNMPNATPEIFLNQDLVIMEAGINSDSPNNSEYPLSVKNFRTGETVKVLPIKFDFKSLVNNQVRFSEYGPGMTAIYVNQLTNENKILSSLKYILDTKTLEVQKDR